MPLCTECGNSEVLNISLWAPLNQPDLTNVCYILLLSSQTFIKSFEVVSSNSSSGFLEAFQAVLFAHWLSTYFQSSHSIVLHYGWDLLFSWAQTLTHESFNLKKTLPNPRDMLKPQLTEAKNHTVSLFPGQAATKTHFVFMYSALKCAGQ